METHPFFALLLMYLKFVSVADMKKISTNGRCIYFSPNFLDKLYDYELDYILCHQIMHIISDHIWRPLDQERADYHFACDLFVNDFLMRRGFSAERYPHLGTVYFKIPCSEKFPSEITVEEILGLLPYSLYAFEERARDTFLIDDAQWWDNQSDSGSCGELILDVWEEDGDADRVRWNEYVAAAAQAAKKLQNAKSDVDDVPAFLERILAQKRQPTVDWRKLLNSFLQEQICDYSFSPPDRRFADTGFFLPDFNERDFVAKEIWFMVDTSGSVDDEALGLVYSEICGAIVQFGDKLNGRLGFFDAAVTAPVPFESVEELLRIVPRGGGGTDFRAVFNYIRENCSAALPSCLVIFTDGYGPYPRESDTMGIPTLWIINNTDAVPPFGKCIRTGKLRHE